MFDVRFIHWGQGRGALALLSWFNVSHWVHRNEQVWIDDTRYEVIRVEHAQDGLDVVCFIREIN